MLRLDVVMQGETHTERLSIDDDIENITIESDPDCPPECDATLWDWISTHFSENNAGLDGEQGPMEYDANGVCERNGVRYYENFASFIEH